MEETNVQYLSDESGNRTAVVIPIELWQEIRSERETAYLLQSQMMKQRLISAKSREEGISLRDSQVLLGLEGGYDFPSLSESVVAVVEKVNSQSDYRL